ncbi:hypothetical protein CAEBREN_29272 [Caenorhabditis brenneri]|uniref:Aromatic amino acid beta-eliminating lyase/threonine aldolase domain-containing protein n=1 Tax=Caenorhabditis brenneri TaxID=135651 RepID=G0P216_CAEBE|nr:hypothetical protein CAEBREN_29272 [Caenorhabditis brenneri]
MLAERRGLKVHMDGARIYNAAVACNTTVKHIASFADTVQMCFSKGLGAPVGSIVVGPKAFIDCARHSRKALGGGWRQSGVLAAAAHVALDHAEATIKADHERAKKLSKMTFDSRRIRMVLNWNVNDENLETIVQVYKKFVAQL